MRETGRTEEMETFGDRLVSAIVSALAMLLTIGLGPLALISYARFTHANPFMVYEHYERALYWGAALIAIAFGVGFAVGSRRMATVWGYLWNTEDPPRPGITGAIWAGILVLIAISYLWK